MAEFVEVSGYDPPTPRYPTNFTTNVPTNSPAGDSLYNKYVVIGVLAFFVALFLVTVIIHLFRSKICCKDHSLDVLYAQVSDPETSSLAGSDDDNLDQMYTSCQLYVGDDDEVNTGVAADDFEYDCSSLDGMLSVKERKVLVDVLRGDYRSNVT